MIYLLLKTQLPEYKLVFWSLIILQWVSQSHPYIQLFPQCVCVCVCVCVCTRARSVRIVAHQAPLFMELSRQEYWSGLPFSSPRHLPDPAIEPASWALAGESLPLQHLESPSSHSANNNSLYSTQMFMRYLSQESCEVSQPSVMKEVRLGPRVSMYLPGLLLLTQWPHGREGTEYNLVSSHKVESSFLIKEHLMCDNMFVIWLWQKLLTKKSQPLQICWGFIVQCSNIYEFNYSVTEQSSVLLWV